MKKAELEDRRTEFLDTAERRYAGIAASGKAVPWREMRRYLERRVGGSKAVRPKSRPLSR